LIEGIITTVIGIAAYMLMADRPETARWLSPEEKKLAADRIKADQVGSTILLEGMNVRAIKEGIFATTTLVNGLMFMLNNITVTGVAFFAPTIVATIYPTKSTIQKQLYTVPPYIVGALCTCIVSTPFILGRLSMLIFSIPWDYSVPLHHDQSQEKRCCYAVYRAVSDHRVHHFRVDDELASPLRCALLDLGRISKFRGV
jgi:hypothetical protein